MTGPNTYIIRCPACKTKNRIPAAKLNQGPKCGKCSQPLNVSGLNQASPLVVTDSSFEREVLASPLPVLLDCWAEWCGPCRMVGPVIDELAREWQGRVRTAKLNVDQNPATSAKFQIRSIPTLLVFDGGRLVETLVGALPKEEIKRKMASFLS